MKYVILVLVIFISGCNNIPSEPNGQDILSEINDIQRNVQRITRIDTIPDISILNTIGEIQKHKAKKQEQGK